MFRKFVSLQLAIVMAVLLCTQPAFAATTARHYLGEGAGGTAITVWNRYYNQNTTLGPTINNHNLYYDNAGHDAFCMNAFLGADTYYTPGEYTQGLGTEYVLALKLIAMYNDGYPQGYDDRVRKMATQICFFHASQLGVDQEYWYSAMFGGSYYEAAAVALWTAGYTYTTPPTSIDTTLGAPNNITNVKLTLNSSTNCYEATVNAGANAQYYTWNGYASRSGNYIKFSVPAAEISNWTGKYNGYPSYTSPEITGYGAYTKIIEPIVWNANRGANYQSMMTAETKYVRPSNTIQYSLYVEQKLEQDEGRPGGGGGLYGGSISTSSAVAGGGSGYVGTGSNVKSGQTSQYNTSIPVPDDSNDGYARITLVE